MATWEVSMVTMVRAMINDLDEATFTDEKIKTSIVTSGIVVGTEYDYSNDYIFDIEQLTITPDPVAVGDNDAVALMSLRSACLLDLNKYQTGIGQGIRVKDGSSEVDTTAGFGGFKDIIIYGSCKSYEKLIKQLRQQRSMMSVGRAVFIPENYVDINVDFMQDFYNQFARYGNIRSVPHI